MSTNCPSVLFAFVIGSIVAAADPGPSDEPRIDCREGGRTQLEMSTCAGREADAANTRLTRLITELNGVLEPKARERLAKVQSSWIALRDLDCEWERSLFEDGSVAPMVYANCIAGQIEQRIQRLKIFLCEGAGMTGPCEASRKYDSSDAPRSRTRG